MAKIPNIDCVFYTNFGKCAHPDRGRGFLWLGKHCILFDEFPSTCRKRVKHEFIKNHLATES